MKMKNKRIGILIILVILLVLSARVGYAQGQSPIGASVDRTSLSTDEVLILTVTVSAGGLNPPQPALPALAGFDVVSSGTSSQITIVNGEMSAQITYSYHLHPNQAGDVIIEPISLTLDGQTYTTAPITVQVTQGTGTTQATPAYGGAAQAPGELAGQNFFVEANADNPLPYLGQPVVYSFRLYQAVDFFSQPQYEAPAFTGFWSEHQPGQSQYTTQSAGRTYQVTELQTVLFPTTVGPVTIGPAGLIIPGGFFERDTALRTEPVILEVKSLPAGAPAGFEGAVGQFSLTSEVDTTQGKVNEPITMRVTLNGQGNLNAVPDPVWPEMPKWRTFETQGTINTQSQDGQVGGSRIYERLLVPEDAGQFTIPPIEYVYFDPVAAEYRTTGTEAIPVSISAGAAEVPASPLLISSGKEEVELIATDIRYLEPVPPVLNLTSPPWSERGVYWLAWGFPMLALVGNFAWQWRRRHWRSNIAQVRSSQARRKARKALTQARRRQKDPYTAAGQILTTYITEKLNQPVGGLTHEALSNLFAQKGLGLHLAERVETCLAASEMGRFSPDGSDPGYAGSLLRQTDTLISDLDKAF